MTLDLRRLAEQATPGPWMTLEGALYGKEDRDLAHIHSDLDAAYIAAANPQAILALLDKEKEWRERAHKFHRLSNELGRRVAALEGQIDAIREAWEQRHVKPEWMDGVQRILDQEAAR